jgi:hypothetical protein
MAMAHVFFYLHSVPGSVEPTETTVLPQMLHLHPLATGAVSEDLQEEGHGYRAKAPSGNFSKLHRSSPQI